MRPCNRILTSLTLLLAFGTGLQAQDYTERVRENMDIAAGVYHPYHHGNLSDTPAPKGYKPFYISHYGRHGSRYHTTLKYFKPCADGLQKGMDEGILTETGKQLYRDFFAVMNEHKGMEGQLTPRGAAEHRGIAQRMYGRFTNVFKDKDRTEVDCASSNVPRCIISMANFTTQLKDSRPELQFSFVTGDKYYDYIAKNIDSKELFDKCNEYEDSVRKATCHYDKLIESIFTNREKGLEAVKDPQKFIKALFRAGSICGDLDYLGIDLFKYFDSRELAEQGAVRSDKFYGQFGNSAEWGETSSAAAKDLVKDFVDRADAALKDGSHRAADLRFGHDVGILPFYGLVGIKGEDVRRPMDGATAFWTTYDRIPMGTNFQMIFYRNRKGDVLVKMLDNEQETGIPSLKPYSGPYYRWSDLREHLVRISE